MLTRLKESVRNLMPGLGLKRWLIVVLVGLTQIALGLGVWLGGVLRGSNRSTLARLATLGGLPRWLRVLLHVPRLGAPEPCPDEADGPRTG